MPRAAIAPLPEPELEPKPMDIQEMVAKQERVTEQERAAEPERAAEHDEQLEEEYKETITLRAAYFYALQNTLEDIRFQIADIQRDARQDRLETQDMLRAILDRLPPAPAHLHDVLVIFTPLALHFYFLYPHTVVVRILGLGVLFVHILFFIMHFILIMVYFLL
jgi:hypothetical protein